MSDQERLEAARTRYLAPLHAMQSGIATELGMPGRHADFEPKHLRVGINSAMVEHSALVQLLVAKGVITELEYFESLATMMEFEKSSYEARLSSLSGAKISLA